MYFRCENLNPDPMHSSYSQCCLKFTYFFKKQTCFFRYCGEVSELLTEKFFMKVKEGTLEVFDGFGIKMLTWQWESLVQSSSRQATQHSFPTIVGEYFHHKAVDLGSVSNFLFVCLRMGGEENVTGKKTLLLCQCGFLLLVCYGFVLFLVVVVGCFFGVCVCFLFLFWWFFLLVGWFVGIFFLLNR